MRSIRRKNVLETIAKKNSLTSIKIKNELSAQQKALEEVQELIQRINDLQEQAKNQNLSSPTSLRASQWYALKLSEQFSILKNRIDFIETEIGNIRDRARNNSIKRNKISDLIQEAKNIISKEKDSAEEKKLTFVKLH